MILKETEGEISTKRNLVCLVEGRLNDSEYPCIRAEYIEGSNEIVFIQTPSYVEEGNEEVVASYDIKTRVLECRSDCDEVPMVRFVNLLEAVIDAACSN